MPGTLGQEKRSFFAALAPPIRPVSSGPVPACPQNSPKNSFQAKTAMRLVTCTWPRSKNGVPVHPVFLPFAGCRVRCVYCAQGLQTGEGEGELETTLMRAETSLRERTKRGLPPCEVAFYGGTFTAQSEDALGRCLEKAKAWKKEGMALSFRCSTKPEAVDSVMLDRLKDAGFGCVELGIQSFDDRVLEASRRGYDARTAKDAMRIVKEAGLRLGAQLLPGLPFSTPEGFLGDVAASLEARADFLRFYPCLVVETTALARLWRAGKFVPWDASTTLEALARGVLLAHRQNVPVARIGVAVEEAFEEHVLAGPRDPDIGTRALARSLVLLLEESLGGRGDGNGATKPPAISRASFPRFVQGYLWGQEGENREILEKMGLQKDKILWEDTEEIRIWVS